MGNPPPGGPLFEALLQVSGALPNAAESESAVIWLKSVRRNGRFVMVTV